MTDILTSLTCVRRGKSPQPTHRAKPTRWHTGLQLGHFLGVSSLSALKTQRLVIEWLTSWPNLQLGHFFFKVAKLRTRVHVICSWHAFQTPARRFRCGAKRAPFQAGIVDSFMKAHATGPSGLGSRVRKSPVTFLKKNHVSLEMSARRDYALPRPDRAAPNSMKSSMHFQQHLDGLTATI